MSRTSIEIASQPAVWKRALRTALPSAAVLAAPGERVLFLGCGTSAFMAESVARLREAAGLGESDAAYAPEAPTGRRYDRVVALCRSGTTTEVLQALEKFAGTRRVAVTAVAGEPIDDLVDDVVLLDFADETSVVQTRFPTTLLLLARAAFGADVSGLPDDCAAALEKALPVDPRDHDHVVYLGAGWAHGLAQEAALKIREAAQAWSESYPLLDYRHGPIAVAHPGSLVWLFGDAPASLRADIAATGAQVLAGTDDPLVQLVDAQRYAVAAAVARGLDPDQPRYLTRSVVLPAGSDAVVLPAPD